jgi:hypothetical protein
MKIKMPFFAGLVFGAGVVGTSIEGLAASDVIYGCVNKAGKIRIVDHCNDCRRTEECISWNKAESPRRTIRRSRRGFRDGQRYLLDPQGRNVYQPLP